MIIGIVIGAVVAIGFLGLALISAGEAAEMENAPQHLQRARQAFFKEDYDRTVRELEGAFVIPAIGEYTAEHAGTAYAALEIYEKVVGATGCRTSTRIPAVKAQLRAVANGEDGATVDLESAARVLQTIKFAKGATTPGSTGYGVIDR